MADSYTFKSSKKVTESYKGGRKKMFKLHAHYEPAGDQPQAINELVKGLEEGKKTIFTRRYWNRKNFHYS